MADKAMTIEFEDQGQDYREWDLDKDGKILASFPFGETYVGEFVPLDSISIGQRPIIKLSYGSFRCQFKVTNIINHPKP
jgi:hypothetical protein